MNGPPMSLLGHPDLNKEHQAIYCSPFDFTPILPAKMPRTTSWFWEEAPGSRHQELECFM